MVYASVLFGPQRNPLPLPVYQHGSGTGLAPGDDLRRRVHYPPCLLCLRPPPAGCGTSASRRRGRRTSVSGVGGFGSVWLQRRFRGTDAELVDVRAVKEIRKPVQLNRPASSKASGAIDYTRELEAVAKFSHAKVGYGYFLVQIAIAKKVCSNRLEKKNSSISTVSSVPSAGTRMTTPSSSRWSILPTATSSLI